jgi:hypothetical protein
MNSSKIIGAVFKNYQFGNWLHRCNKDYLQFQISQFIGFKN